MVSPTGQAWKKKLTTHLRRRLLHLLLHLLLLHLHRHRVAAAAAAVRLLLLRRRHRRHLPRLLLHLLLRLLLLLHLALHLLLPRERLLRRFVVRACVETMTCGASGAGVRSTQPRGE